MHYTQAVGYLEVRFLSSVRRRSRTGICTRLRIWGSESSSAGSTPAACIHGPVAQSEEQLAVNQRVVGSSPTGIADALYRYISVANGYIYRYLKWGSSLRTGIVQVRYLVPLAIREAIRAQALKSEK